MKAAKKTMALKTTITNSPANVKNWFTKGLFGATVWKIWFIPFTTERKSFLAIHIMKITRKRFPHVKVNPWGSKFMILFISMYGLISLRICLNPSIMCGVIWRKRIKTVIMITRIGIKLKIKLKAQADAQASRLFFKKNLKAKKIWE